MKIILSCTNRADSTVYNTFLHTYTSYSSYLIYRTTKKVPIIIIINGPLKAIASFIPQLQGAVLYIAVIGDDSDTPINLPNDIDLIDDFMITINSTLSVNEETEMILYWGRNNLTHIVLSSQVECAPDFTGDRRETVIDNCIDPLSNCSGNGECI